MQLFIGGIDAYGEFSNICEIRKFEKADDARELWLYPFAAGEKFVHGSARKDIYRHGDVLITIGDPGKCCAKIEGPTKEDIAHTLTQLGFESGVIRDYLKIKTR